MVITQETDTAAQSDKIICMYNGRIKEEGRPQDLVANPKSKFGKMLK
jgi:ABC-type multidrug transport system fused ATPase/permease subunit